MTNWYVYIVRCADNSLYTGIARSVDERVAQHNGSGRGARYTRSRRPVHLVYREQFESHSEAARREASIKRMKKTAKERLVGEFLALRI